MNVKSIQIRLELRILADSGTCQPEDGLRWVLNSDECRIQMSVEVR
jgi:hypothetical protein